MHRVILLILVGLFLVPTAADAGTGKFMCQVNHFIRLGGAETVEGIISLINGNEVEPVTIERLTFRNAFGAVVHDSGPAIGVPHLLNTDFSPPEDITVIAPSRAFYIKTKHIWGLFSIPGPAGNEQGFHLSLVVEFSMEGNLDLFRVWAMRRVRERLVGPSQGEERVTARNYCFRIRK